MTDTLPLTLNFRQEMQHFVKVMQGYIANQIIDVTWREFQDDLNKVQTLDELHHCHAEYLNKCVLRYDTSIQLDTSNIY